jgi:hypothetical protein
MRFSSLLLLFFLTVFPVPAILPDSAYGNPQEKAGAPVRWQVVINDPAPGNEPALPGNSLTRVSWWPGVNPHTRSMSVISFFGQPGDMQRKEWAMLYILMARMSGTAPANGVVGTVTRQGAEWRVVGYFEDAQEDETGKVTGRRRIHVDRVISGLQSTRDDFTAFCEWRYGVAPW